MELVQCSGRGRGAYKHTDAWITGHSKYCTAIMDRLSTDHDRLSPHTEWQHYLYG